MKKLLFLLAFLPFLSNGQTIISNNLSVTAPKALDARTGKFVSGAWIPFASTTEANAAILTTRRYEGLTICIGTATNCTEYWYHGGIADGNLVLKFVDGGGGGSVASVFGRTGTVTAQSGDYTGAQITQDATHRFATDAEKTAWNAKLDASSTLNASNITAGTLPIARIADGSVTATKLNASGTPSSTTFFRGDGTWAAPAGGGAVDTTSLSNRINSLPKVLNVIDYGANPNDTLDDGVAINLAVRAAYDRGGGVVFFPLPTTEGRHYLVKSPLITSMNGVNPNAQIVIPLDSNTGSVRVIKFLGEVPPSFATEGIAGVPRNQKGCIIESTIQGTGTLPAVFGTSYYASGIWGDRNFVKVLMENLIIRTSTITNGNHVAGTMSGIVFTRLAAFGIDNYVKVDISSPLASSVEMTNVTVGIFFPDVNNKVELSCGVICAEGYYQGVAAGEHLNIQHLQVYGCVEGLAIPFGFHSISIQHMTAEVNKYQISLRGTSRLTILNYETEHYYGAGWYAFRGDILQVSGTSSVRIFNSNVVQSGVGYVNEFITSGSPDYRIFNGAGENVTYGGGSDVTPPTFVSAAVQNATPTKVNLVASEALSTSMPAASTFAVSGHTVSAVTYVDAFHVDLTVDAFSPGETRAVSLTKNGTNNIKDLATPPNEMANFTGLTITDNVGVTVLLADDFNRANSSSSLGNTVVPGGAWPAPFSGTWGISSNMAYCSTEVGTGSFTVETQPYDIGTADFDLTVDLVFAANTNGGIAFRATDNTHYYYLQYNTITGIVTLYARNGATFTTIEAASYTGTPGAATLPVGISANGSSITLSFNGIANVPIIDATYTTQTKLGLAVGSGSTFGGGAKFDNLNVQ